ncbi:MAG: hypothetical protein Q8N53_22520 [Longimicrobiales bacterium]|nr:hypothetical protein [Longimicrobiales bacterium]
MAILMPSHLLVLLTALGPARAAVATMAGLLLCTSLVAAQPAAEPVRPGLRESDDGRDYAQVEQLVIQGLLAPDQDSAKALFQESVACARVLVAMAPADPQAHYLLSVALGYQLEHEGLRKKLVIAAEARAEAEQALELEPGHAGAHHVMGRLHAAAMRLNRVARLVAREILGASVLEGASWERAEFHFKQAALNDPSSPRHAMELGALYIDTGRPAMARVVLTEAARLALREPSDPLATARVRVLLAQLALE